MKITNILREKKSRKDKQKINIEKTIIDFKILKRKKGRKKEREKGKLHRTAKA